MHKPAFAGRAFARPVYGVAFSVRRTAANGKMVEAGGVEPPSETASL